MDKRVRKEISDALAKGEGWTPWRKMRPTERVGAAFCGTQPRPRSCTKVSEYVSYSTSIAGRVVSCGPCLRRKTGGELPKAKARAAP